MKKKKVLYHSNFCGSKTGFGRNAREVLTYLYKTGKYDIVEYAAGLRWSDPLTTRVPWKCRGTWPDNEQEIAHIQNHPNFEGIKRQISYGSHNIDRIMREEKPDIYIGAEDIWAFSGYIDKKWWGKIPCVIHTTLDSLPIYDYAVEVAKVTPNFLVWASFAEKALKDLGCPNVKTVHGIINQKHFQRLPKVLKQDLRAKFDINPDEFIIGFVFRNQLRKSVPNLMEGYKLFCDRNPKIKAKLLLHTNFEELEQGWDIPRLSKQYEIDPKNVYTTYICRHCGEYEVKAFTGNDASCKFCGAQPNPAASNPQERRGQRTTGTDFGVTESQLNEIYNLMNVYVHPMTSGGQEMPINEAKLVELVTLVTSYSCGEDWCTEESGGMPLDWAKYTEHGTQFIKASTIPQSITTQLEKFYRLSDDKKAQMGKLARNFIIKKCSPEAVGKQFEEIIDAAPITEYTFDLQEPRCNDSFEFPEIESEEDFVKSLYQNILMREPDADGFNYWLKFLR
jgi:glycosyltransferase involved in cell wall biosynthesis